jgi:hypothetical protein
MKKKKKILLNKLKKINPINKDLKQKIEDLKTELKL